MNIPLTLNEQELLQRIEEDIQDLSKQANEAQALADAASSETHRDSWRKVAESSRKDISRRSKERESIIKEAKTRLGNKL